MLRCPIQAAKNIHIAGLRQLVHPSPLKRQKTGRIAIFPWPLQVDFPVGSIKIPAQHQALAVFAQLLAVVQKSRTEFHFEWHPGVIPLAIGKIGVNQREIGKTRPQHAPLAVEMGYPQSLDDLLWFGSTVEAEPAITLFFSCDPPAVIAGGMQQIVFKLLGPGPGFLHAEHIGADFFKPREKTLARHRADAVYIP